MQVSESLTLLGGVSSGRMLADPGGTGQVPVKDMVGGGGVEWRDDDDDVEDEGVVVDVDSKDNDDVAHRAG